MDLRNQVVVRLQRKMRSNMGHNGLRGCGLMLQKEEYLGCKFFQEMRIASTAIIHNQFFVPLPNQELPIRGYAPTGHGQFYRAVGA